jgi:predicted nuclease with TOPRIM domain
MDDDKADWLHEVKRDKRLDRIAELEGEVSLLTDALANYEQENARLRWEMDERDEYTLCDCCESLTTDALDAGGHMQCRSCTEAATLRAQVAALTKDNDDIHELAEHYRVENGRLREALSKVVMHTARLPLATPELLNGLLDSCERIARAALKQPPKPPEWEQTDACKMTPPWGGPSFGCYCPGCIEKRTALENVDRSLRKPPGS